MKKKEVNINEEIYNKLKELNFNFELSKSGEYINVLLFIFAIIIILFPEFLK